MRDFLKVVQKKLNLSDYSLSTCSLYYHDFSKYWVLFSLENQ